MTYRHLRAAFGFVASVIPISACQAHDDPGPGAPIGPPLGKADGTNFADQECRIILRETTVSEDGTTLVGLVDVQTVEIAAGSLPYVALTTVLGSSNAADFQHVCPGNVRTPGGGACLSESLTRVAELDNGFSRFRFELALATLGADAVELIPYLDLTDGRGIAWDHNRPESDAPGSFRPAQRPGPFNDNYLARAPNFAIPLDENTCDRVECQQPGVVVTRAYEGVPLRDPTSIEWEPNATPRRVFVSEKLGNIVAFPDRDDAFSNDAIVTRGCGDPGLAPGEACVFLPWTEETYKRGGRFGDDAPGWEEGLLDFAFHPDWPATPEVFVTYNSGIGDPEDEGNRGSAFWNLARFRSDDGGRSLDPESVQVLLSLEKRGLTHNAGSLLFHPDDGNLLYVAIGTDGGFPFDRYDHAQNPNDLFGTVLRMDVIEDDDWTPAERAQGFAVPRDNPFVGGTTDGVDCPPGEFRRDPACRRAAHPLVWAYGTRNPWGMSLDRATGRIYGAEVGENQREELNTYVAGGNYGYPIFEGDVCTGRGRCDRRDRLEFPLFVGYASDQARPADAIVSDSITGGFVVRGDRLPDLAGKYVFGDFVSGALFFWDPAQPARPPRLLENSGRSIARFGENPEGDLVFLDHRHQEFRVEAEPDRRADGGVYRLEAGACKTETPPPAVTYAFLSADGVGDEDSAAAYYRTNLELVSALRSDGIVRTLETYTLAQWKQDFGFAAGETETAIYKNEWDLAFFRDMTCTHTIERGVGGCAVTNWDNPDRAGNHLGTVTMNLSQEGYVQFWVFGDGGERDQNGAPLETDDRIQTFAILDDENGNGPDDADRKFVPNVCTPCHGGVKYRINGSTDIGAVFREFEPSLLLVADDNRSIEGELRAAFRGFNAAVATGNRALNTATPMIAYIEQELYPEGPLGAAEAIDAFADGTVPPSWADDERGDAELIAAKRALWRDLVHPYCMTCHRIRKVEVDFSEYARFEGLGDERDGNVALYTYITGSYRPGETDGHPIFMPQTQHLFDRLNGDADQATLGALDPTDPLGQNAKAAILAWLAAVNRAAPTCDVTFRVQTGVETQVGEDVYITGFVGDVDSGELGSFQPWDGVKLLGRDGGTLWTNAEPNEAAGVLGPVALPQGRRLEFQAVIVDGRASTRAACGGGPRLRWQTPPFANETAIVRSGDACEQVIELDLRTRGFGAPLCE